MHIRQTDNSLKRTHSLLKPSRSNFVRSVLSRARYVINFEGARSHYFKIAETLIADAIFTLSRFEE